MKQPWLARPIEITFTAIGLVSLVYSMAIFALGDAVTLLDGKVVHWGNRDFFYLPLSAVAALFSAFTFFIWRRWLPKLLMALMSLAVASHIAERFIALPTQSLRLIAALRILISLAVIAVFLWQRFVEKVPVSAH